MSQAALVQELARAVGFPNPGIEIFEEASHKKMEDKPWKY
jgi:hypothetical protein